MSADLLRSRARVRAFQALSHCTLSSTVGLGLSSAQLQNELRVVECPKAPETTSDRGGFPSPSWFQSPRSEMQNYYNLS